MAPTDSPTFEWIDGNLMNVAVDRNVYTVYPVRMEGFLPDLTIDDPVSVAAYARVYTLLRRGSTWRWVLTSSTGLDESASGQPYREMVAVLNFNQLRVRPYIHSTDRSSRTCYVMNPAYVRYQMTGTPLEDRTITYGYRPMIDSTGYLADYSVNMRPDSEVRERITTFYIL